MSSSDATTENIIVDESKEAEAAGSNTFDVDEKVLGFHGSCLYEAKVLEVKSSSNGLKYYIHYRGWNNKWDEWVDGDRLLKHTEENIRRQKNLEKKTSTEQNVNPIHLSIGLKGKKRKRKTIDDDVNVTPLATLNIPIPHPLKQRLVDDYECITKSGQLVKLPRTPCVDEILKKYFHYRTKDGRNVDAINEIVKGLHTYFDKALPTVLLYKNERQQYKQVIEDNVSPSTVYGAEHLLRLFVKLPEMLADIRIEIETFKKLKEKSVDLLRFLQINQNTFFLTNYQTCDVYSSSSIKDDK